MTYQPTPPTSPGYPASQPSGGYPGPAAPSYPAVAAGVAGPSKVPGYLLAAVALLGLGAYLAGFGPLFSIKSDIGPFGGAQFTASGLTYWTVASLVAALLAAVGLLPESKTYTPVVAVTAVLGLLLVIGQMIHRPTGFSVGWGLWLVLLLTIFQAAAAVAALLFETGVLTSPAPRPNYAPYGPPHGGYYGQPGVQHGAQPYPGQQQSGYQPQQYGGYNPVIPGQGVGQPPGRPADLDTPPHGFPSYSPSAATAMTGSDPTVSNQPAREVSWESTPSVTSEPTAGSSGSTQP